MSNGQYRSSPTSLSYGNNTLSFGNNTISFRPGNSNTITTDYNSTKYNNYGVSSTTNNIASLIGNSSSATNNIASLIGNSTNFNSSASASTYRSEIENAILNAREPLRNLSSRDIYEKGPYRGIYLNKHEVDLWRGPVPIDQFQLYHDPNPEIVKRRLDRVPYTRELGVRYLNPPPAQKPGDLIIRERQGSAQITAPPLIIRQETERSKTPPPLIYREAPPPLPPRIPEQV